MVKERESSNLDLSVLPAFLLAELCPKRLRAEDLAEVVPIFPSHEESSRKEA